MVLKEKNTSGKLPADAYDKTSLSDYCDLLAQKDKRIKSLLKEKGYPPFWHRQPGFESLVMIILEQQVSLASAFSVFRKLKERIGSITPANIVKMTDDDFKTCGFSRQKRSYISGLADEVLQGRLDVPSLNHLEEAEIRRQLTAIKGIGNWTADIYLLSCLHKLDIFPIGDLALVKAMEQAAFIKPGDSKETVQHKVNKFRPYRSIFTVLMWHCYIRDNNITPPFDL